MHDIRDDAGIPRCVGYVWGYAGIISKICRIFVGYADIISKMCRTFVGCADIISKICRIFVVHIFNI